MSFVTANKEAEKFFSDIEEIAVTLVNRGRLLTYAGAGLEEVKPQLAAPVVLAGEDVTRDALRIIDIVEITRARLPKYPRV